MNKINMHNSVAVYLLALALLCSLCTAQTCSISAFPTSNDNPPAGEYVDLDEMNGGVFSAITAIGCKTPGSSDAFGFAKFNLNYVGSSVNVANICYLQTLIQGSGY